ncbi:MAG TPA: CDP-6-deoxy-delta-3,4-glucoseen reductase [Acetobacteraceae bacterium]
MTYQIRVAQSDIAFDCEPGTTILDAARKHGYELPYSCRNGICGSCKGRILSGSVQAAGASEALSREEEAQGYALFCRACPSSDVEIGARSISKLDPNAHRSINAKVHKLTRAADDVTVLQLRFPAGARVRFKAGQYLQVLMADGSRRSFSMANPPQQNDGAQLHIRHMPGGRFSSYLESGAAVGDIVSLEMPFGNFYLRDGDKPLVFVASGTGFAPIKSILEEMFKRGKPQRPIALYWGARRKADLYMADLPQKWARQYPENFRFIPVLSEEQDAECRFGLVHRAVMEDFPSLAGQEVYACGAPGMITAARVDFIGQCGLPADSYYCDAFVTEAAQD